MLSLINVRTRCFRETLPWTLTLKDSTHAQLARHFLPCRATMLQSLSFLCLQFESEWIWLLDLPSIAWWARLVPRIPTRVGAAHAFNHAMPSGCGSAMLSKTSKSGRAPMRLILTASIDTPSCSAISSRKLWTTWVLNISGLMPGIASAARGRVHLDHQWPSTLSCQIRQSHLCRVLSGSKSVQDIRLQRKIGMVANLLVNYQTLIPLEWALRSSEGGICSTLISSLSAGWHSGIQ